jgi:subtilisin family serine protease
MEKVIKVFVSMNKPARGVKVSKVSADERVSVRYLQKHYEVPIDPAEESLALVLASAESGSWSLIVERPWASKRVDLPALPKNGPLGWWHTYSGIDGSSHHRGSGVTVGVVDEGLTVLPTDQMLGHVEIIEPRDEDMSWVELGYLPRTDHGNAVASLMFGRCGKAGFEGVAPGAKAFFFGARLPKALRPAENNGRGLNPGMVARGIRRLSLECGCDIINLSAGLPYNIPTVHDAIVDAQANGTLVFVAAGNSGPDTVVYPAVHDEAVAVAAIGRRGFAPSFTCEARDDQMSQCEIEEGHYLWASSAVGPHVQFAAPGSNVIWSFQGEGASAVSGTSYSSPIAAAIAAVILSDRLDEWQSIPRSKDRWNTMLSILNDSVPDKDRPSALKGGAILRVPGL